LVAPLKAEDLSDQPQTLLVTAELDLLRDEGEAYGQALEAAGNRVSIHRGPNALHGFITLPRLARPVRDAYRVIGAFLDGYRSSSDAADPPDDAGDSSDANPAPESA
jgi:acetyl esterase/lipase